MVLAQLSANLVSGEAANKQLADSIEANSRLQEELKDRADAAQNRIQALDLDIRRDEAQIATLEAEIAKERAQIRLLARMIRAEPSSLLVLAARSANLTDLIGSATNLMAAGARASAIENRIDAQLQEVAADRARSERARVEETRLGDQLTVDLATLVELAQLQAIAAQQLDLKLAQTQVEQRVADKQSAALAAQIAKRLQEQQEQIIADAMARAWQQALLWIKDHPGVPGVSPSHSTKYRFIWPEAQGTITQGFGPTDLALEPGYAGYPHFHTGIDIAAPRATQVLAADDGVVAAVGDGTTGYGRYVVLSHRDRMVTLYGHLDQPLVKVGDQVLQGQPIGLEGSTGNSTGPHLHFELRIDGTPTDPAPMLPPGGPGG